MPVSITSSRVVHPGEGLQIIAVHMKAIASTKTVEAICRLNLRKADVRLIGKRFALPGTVRKEEARREGPAVLKLGENLLVLSNCTPEADWPEVFRSMRTLISDQKGYSPLQIQSSLERILKSPQQPALHGRGLAYFHGRMFGLEDPFIVVALIPKHAGSSRSWVRHVMLRAALPVSSKAEQRLIHRVDACLGDQENLARLLATHSAFAFANALLDAVNSPLVAPQEPPQARKAESGVNLRDGLPCEPSRPEVTFNLVRVWVERAEKNGSRCAVCLRIVEGNRELGKLGSIKVGGVDYSPESQIAHLSRCAG